MAEEQVEPMEGDVPAQGDAGVLAGQDEAVNTVDAGAADEGVIASYTAMDVQEATEEPIPEPAPEQPVTGSRPASAEGPSSRQPSAAGEAGVTNSRPGSAAVVTPGDQQGHDTPSGDPASEIPADPSRPSSAAVEVAASTSRPGSAEPEPDGTAQSAVAEPAPEPAASRPASAQPDTNTLDEPQPADSSRPGSAVAADAIPPNSSDAAAVALASSRPVSANVAAEPPLTAGSRPASAVASAPAVTGSRPASAVAAGSPPPSTPAQPEASAAPAGSRPASAVPPASTDVAAPAPGSRPTSALPPAAPASRPTSSQAGAGPGVDDLPLTAQPTDPGARLSSHLSGPSTATPVTTGSRPASGADPATTSKAAGSSRPGSGTPAGTTPGQEAADARPSSAAAKVQAAEEAGYVVTGMRAIDVEVDQGPALAHRMLRVYLDYTQVDNKAYLGGFRNKRTGATFHHAATQTPKAPRYANAEPKLERQTQTVKVLTCHQQTVREASTQMERPGVVLDTTHDRVKTPGRYQTSEERLAIVTAATRTIQRWVRGWIGRKRAAYLRSKKREREQFLQEQEAKALRAAEEHRRREIERRMHPRTAADFEILYNELEAWRLQETRKIKEAGLAPDKEQEVLQQLLHKETKLLQTIDRLKINANHENKDIRIQRTLGDMSKPKQFELKNGNKVEVHTPFTTRAKELMQLYNGLNLPMLTIDERLDVLLHVKWTVKEFDCNLTREIVALIDREADLLNRGRSPAMLEGLRKRISSMFLNFCETPEFNPESSRFQVVPMDFENYLFQKLEKASTGEQVTVRSTGKWD